MKKFFAGAAIAASMFFGVSEARADYPPSPAPVVTPRLPKVGADTSSTSELALAFSVAGAALLVAATAARRRSTNS